MGDAQKQQLQQHGEKISVSFTLRFGNEMSQAEGKPMVTCYFSAPIQGQVVEVSLPEDDANQLVNVQMEGIFDSSEPLPSDCKIMFYLTGETLNEAGTNCTPDLGMGSVNLSDLARSGNNTYSEEVTIRFLSLL